MLFYRCLHDFVFGTSLCFNHSCNVHSFDCSSGIECWCCSLCKVILMLLLIVINREHWLGLILIAVAVLVFFFAVIEGGLSSVSWVTRHLNRDGQPTSICFLCSVYLLALPQPVRVHCFSLTVLQKCPISLQGCEDLVTWDPDPETSFRISSFVLFCGHLSPSLGLHITCANHFWGALGEWGWKSEIRGHSLTVLFCTPPYFRVDLGIL